MTVYVLVEEWQCDCDGGVDTAVFQNFEDAQKALEEKIETQRENYKEVETEESYYVEGDMAWEIWETGNYTLNHTKIVIQEREV